MEPVEISRMMAEIIDKMKLSKMSPDFVIPEIIKRDSTPNIPDFNPIYKTTVQLRDRIAVHAEFDKIPYNIIRKRGPYEDDKQYEYRKNNWQNITMPYFMEALSELNRIMNPSNYSIQWKEDQNDEKTYFETDIPTVSSIEDYAEQILLVQKILDPNALVVVKPYAIPTKEIATETGTDYVLDDSQKISPIPVLIPCTLVIEYKDMEYAIVVVEERSLVYVGNKPKPVREGIIFEIYDKENIWRVEQTGQKTKWEFTEPYIYYPHNLGYVPCQKLKGILRQVEKYVYYQSYFIYAIPHLDTAVYEHSNLDISMVTQMFPQRSEIVDRCDNNECDNGWIYSYEDNPADPMRPKRHGIMCNKCNGTGGLSRVGPMGVKKIITPNGFNPVDTTGVPQLPGIAYTAPPAEPLKFVFEKYKHDGGTAFSFMGLHISFDGNNGPETATGKVIDREKLFSFLSRVSNELFDTIGFVIETMGKMRYGNDFISPIISAPTSFQIRSEKDLTDELIESKKAGVPDIALREIIRQIISKRFSNQRNIEPIVNLAFAVDRFITSNTVEMSARLANGTAAKWEAILHDSLYTFIDNTLIDDKEFFSKDFSVQKKTLVDMAKAIAGELSPAVPPVTSMADDE